MGALIWEGQSSCICIKLNNLPSFMLFILLCLLSICKMGTQDQLPPWERVTACVGCCLYSLWLNPGFAAASLAMDGWLGCFCYLFLEAFLPSAYFWPWGPVPFWAHSWKEELSL